MLLVTAEAAPNANCFNSVGIEVDLAITPKLLELLVIEAIATCLTSAGIDLLELTTLKFDCKSFNEAKAICFSSVGRSEVVAIVIEDLMFASALMLIAASAAGRLPVAIAKSAVALAKFVNCVLILNTSASALDCSALAALYSAIKSS